MRILTITNMWPIPNKSFFGIFIKEQVDDINKYFPEVCNRIYFIEGYKNALNYVKSIFTINYHLIFNKYDIIHIHFGLSAIYLLFRFHRKNKVLLTLHGSDINIISSNKIKVWLTKIILKRVDYVICVSDKMIKNASRENNIIVLPCAVNTELFTPSTKLNSRINAIQIVFPSNKERREKNYPLFKAILELLRKNHNISINEVIIDNMSRGEVASTLQETDILILTSISEGSPQIVKEAMSCNIPVVATNVGDTSHLLNGVSNCYVINTFNPKDFIDPILNIISLPKNQRVSNGRDKIFSLGLDSKSTSKRLIDIYKSL